LIFSKYGVVFKQRQKQFEFLQFEGLAQHWSVLRLKHEQEETVQPSSVRILVADDFEPWRRFASLTLRKKPGLQIVGEASNGLEAFEKAVELEPDLILLDISLPSLNGIETARRIREMVPEAKIIFLSEESSGDIVKEAMSFGASGYVFKTMAASDLLTAVETVLAGIKFVNI
jgi:DNA-binding NarL/FixJ family response regulator